MFLLLYLSKHKCLYLEEVTDLSNTIKGVVICLKKIIQDYMKLMTGN